MTTYTHKCVYCGYSIVLTKDGWLDNSGTNRLLCYNPRNHFKPHVPKDYKENSFTKLYLTLKS